MYCVVWWVKVLCARCYHKSCYETLITTTQIESRCELYALAIYARTEDDAAMKTTTQVRSLLHVASENLLKELTPGACGVFTDNTETSQNQDKLWISSFKQIIVVSIFPRILTKNSITYTVVTQALNRQEVNASHCNTVTCLEGDTLAKMN